MTVLQPHYITVGRYTPRVDRKIFSALFAATSDGNTITGVLPPYNHFQVSYSGLTVSVSPGFALIADSPSQNTDSPGVYLCTIDANPETLTLGGDATYQIYAEVAEAQFAITAAAISSNVATITTGTINHNFVVGQTVLVTGVDSTFDGSYVITGTGIVSSQYTFSYSKIASNVSLGAGGYASVPFAIKSTTSGTAPSGSNITLAEVVVSGGVVSSLTDKRTFATARGGVQVYKSTLNSPETGDGRIAYDLDTGNLKYWNKNTSDWTILSYGSTGHHDSVASSTSVDALHHKIGTGAYDAAAGNHTHINLIPLPKVDGNTTPPSIGSANSYVDLGLSAAITPGVVSNSYWVLVNYQAIISATSYPITSDIFLCLAGSGIESISASTSSSIYTQRWRPALSVAGGVVNTLSGSIPIKLTPTSTSQTQTFTLKCNIESVTGTVSVVSASISVVPIGRYS